MSSNILELPFSLASLLALLYVVFYKGREGMMQGIIITIRIIRESSNVKELKERARIVRDESLERMRLCSDERLSNIRVSTFEELEFPGW